jgi:hypothetical protein
MAEEIDQAISQKVASLSSESSEAVALSRSDLAEVTWLRYVLSDNQTFVDSTGQVVDSSKLFAILALRLLDDAAMFILHMSDPRKSDEDGDCLDIASALVTSEQDLRCALLVSDSVTEAMQAISHAEGFLTQKELEVLLNKQHLRGLQEAASLETQRRAQERHQMTMRCKSGAHAKWQRDPLTEGRKKAQELCIHFLQLWRDTPNLYKSESAFIQAMLEKIDLKPDGDPVYSYDTIQKKLLPKWKQQLR